MSDDTATRFELLELDPVHLPVPATPLDEDDSYVRFSLLELDLPGFKPTPCGCLATVPAPAAPTVAQARQEARAESIAQAAAARVETPAPAVVTDAEREIREAMGEGRRTPPVEVTTWKPRVGEVRTVALVRTRERDGRYGRYEEAVLRDERGTHLAVSSCVLLSAFRQVGPGVMCRVEYRGMVQTGSGRRARQMHDWRVNRVGSMELPL